MSNRSRETIKTTLIREIVRDFMEDHLGATPKEIVYGTGLSTKQVALAYRSIRKEWLSRFQKAGPGSTMYGINHRLRAIEQMKGNVIFSMMAPRPDELEVA